MTIVAIGNLEFEERKQRLSSRMDRFAYREDEGEGAFTLRCDRCNDERNSGGRGELESRERQYDGRGDDGNQGGWMPRSEYERMMNSCTTKKIGLFGQLRQRFDELTEESK